MIYFAAVAAGIRRGRKTKAIRERRRTHTKPERYYGLGLARRGAPTGIPLGHLGKVPGRITWVTFLSFWLIVAALATEYFPVRGAELARHPWQAAFAASALLYALFGAQALIRAAIARLIQVTPEEITLLLSGPVVRFRPSSAWKEVVLALLGPITSFGFAAAAYGIAALLLTLGRSELGASIFFWVAGMNLFLGLLHLLPAAPLDGASIVAAAARLNKREAASMSFLSRSARALPFGLIIVGTVLILVGAYLAGLLLAGIAIDLFRLEAPPAAAEKP